MDQEEWFTRRDEIKRAIQATLQTNTTQHWLDALQEHDYWCSDVYTWEKLMASDAFKALDFIQDVSRVEGEHVFTTRCPITFAGEDFGPSKGAPRLGQDTQRIIEEFHLDQEEGE